MKIINTYLHIPMLVTCIFFLNTNMLLGQINVDSAKKAIANLNYDQDKIKPLAELALLSFADHPKEAMNICDECIRLSKKHNDIKSLADCYRIKGNTYGVTGNYTLGLRYYHSSIDIYKSIHDIKGLAKVYNNLGLLYISQENYPKALKYSKESIRINDSIGGFESNYSKAKSHTTLGTILFSMNDFNGALDNYFIATKLLDSLKDPEGFSILLNTIASVYSRLDNFDKAFEYNRKSYSLNMQSHSTAGLNFNYSNLGDWNLRLAKKTTDKVLKDSYLRYSLENTNKALSIGIDAGYTFSNMANYNILFEVYKEMGDWKNATKYLQIYVGLKDSLFSLAKSKEIANLEAMRENLEKESRIELLTKESQVSFFRTLMLIFAVVLLIAILLATFFFFRKKNRSSESMLIKLTKAVEQSGNHVFITDIDGKIEYINKKFTEVTGYSKEEIIGKTPRILKSGMYENDHYKLLWDTILAGKSWNSELVNKKKNGELYWEKNMITPVKDKKGNITNFIAIKEDITKHKQKEEEVIRSNKVLNDVLDAASKVAIISTDKNGMVTIFNKGAENILGYRSEEVVGLYTPLLWHLDSEIKAREMELTAEFGYPVTGFRVYVEKAENNGSDNQHCTYVAKDGSHITVSLVVTPVRSISNEVTGYLGIVQDITNQVIAEQSLKQSEERFRSFIENSVEGMHLLDEEGKIVEWNPAQEKITGFSREEVIGKDWIEIAYQFTIPENQSPEKNERFKIELKSLLETGYSPIAGKAIEAPIITKDGRKLILQQLIFSIKTATGFRIGTINRDITEIKFAGNALRESEEKYRTLFEFANDAIFLMDKNVFLKCNKKTLELFKCEAEQIIGASPDTFSPLYQPDGRPSSEAAFEKINAALGGMPQSFEWMHKRFDGHSFDAEVSLNKVELGDSIFIQAIVRDISERKKAEHEIKELNENLEQKVVERTDELNKALIVIEESNVELKQLNENIAEEAYKLLVLNEKLAVSEQELTIANQTKDKFFSIIAHDLKNPIGGIKSLLELMKNHFDELKEDGLDNLINTAHTASERSYDLLVNLLEWAKIQKGNINFDPAFYSLFEAVEKSIDSVKISAQNKRIKIRHNFNKNDIAFFDDYFINSVLRNLITNAVKFSFEDSEIIVSIDRNYQDNTFTGEFIAVAVKDSGVGIDPDSLTKLFQIDKVQITAGTAKEKGTGLGLILCKEFIERHGGQIRAESEVGKGTTFYFTLPKA